MFYNLMPAPLDAFIQRFATFIYSIKHDLSTITIHAIIFSQSTMTSKFIVGMETFVSSH